jgi:hypothetical protein
MGSRQKRKANMLPAAHYEAAGASAYLDPNTGPRRENGKIVPRHLLVFHTPEEKVIHLTVEYTVRIGDIYKQIEECVGYAVYLQQTDKKNNTVVLDQDEIAEDGMNFGYSVEVKRRTPKLESHFAENVVGRSVRSWACRLHEIPGVLRAADDKGKEATEPGLPPVKAAAVLDRWQSRLDASARVGVKMLAKMQAKQAKEPDPPADDKHKEATEPDPPPDEPESDAAPRGRKRHGRPLAAWVPRGVPETPM